MAKQSPSPRKKMRQHRDNHCGGDAAACRQPRCVAEAMERRLLFSTTFLVTTTADSGAGSLRQAITSADQIAGPSVIDFSIGSGLQTISPPSPLAALSTSITLDGTP